MLFLNQKKFIAFHNTISIKINSDISKQSLQCIGTMLAYQMRACGSYYVKHVVTLRVSKEL